MRDLPTLKLDLKNPEAFGNVAEKLTEDERRTLANDLIELIRVDETSMGEWLGEAKGYLDEVEAGSSQQSTANEEQRSAGEKDPPSTEMTLAAMIQFAARATGALLGEPDLAKSSEEGGEALAKWVSRQLRTVDPNWTLDTDPLVVHMAATGLAWRKRTFDDIDRVFHSYFLPCTDVIVNANVRAAERAPRITHQFERYPYEIERSISRKHWVNYGPVFDDNDPQAPKRFYETDAWLDFDDDGMTEPWTIVISLDDLPDVVRINPRWSKKTFVQDKDVTFFRPSRRFYPYMFLPDPKGGFFPMGFGKLLSRVEGTADQLLAAITDTAKSESQNGGVLSGGGTGLPDSVEIKGNRVTGIPSERPLGDVFQAFPSKSVSSGSVAVLEKVMTLGDRLAGTLNLLENAPASMTATLAKGIIDTGSQIQSAVHRRLVASMTQEFRMFVQMADAYGMLPEGVQATDGEGIAVTADPQLATEMQRSALAGVYMEVLTLATKAPGIVNASAVFMRLLQTLRIPNPQELVGTPQPLEATPKEKMDGALGLMKQKNEERKVVADAAVKLTQAIKNLADAGGSALNNQALLLQMAQLEDAVQKMMADNANAGGPGNMAEQPGNQAAGGLPPPEAGGAAEQLSGGDGSPSGGAGEGGGVA